MKLCCLHHLHYYGHLRLLIIPLYPSASLIVCVTVINLNNETSQVHIYTFYSHTVTLNSDDTA
ncbi:hypothetical protein KsCSTR_39080 [Candidatus Kuenenia stuttgartiensis]|uniref:Uncharacterized protein n=1 Tax=Kuenenia stuttgartiensis TaxID=174633 RepID=Q1PUP0_KUEST|nr:hypothetical protein KsCSTR_39080 [Candidatus Kuenenia stuttgartiensis]CAJ70936.1 unknown protein [Candidatus Kuenenia stuttgartiensis]